MVHVYVIEGSDADVKALHDKCKKCNGSQTNRVTSIKCPYNACDQQFHVACIQPLIDSNETPPLEFWFCSDDCDQANEAIHKATLAAKVNQLERCSSKLTTSNPQFNSSFKKLVSMIADSQASSTLVAHGTNVADAALDVSSFSVTISNSINNLMLERSSMLQVPSSSQSQPSQPTQSSSSHAAGATVSSNESQNAHAVASIIMSLSERRKNLPELPEFNGKGSEWLCFRNSYHKIKSMGKYDNDEMITNLRKALRDLPWNTLECGCSQRDQVPLKSSPTSNKSSSVPAQSSLTLTYNNDSSSRVFTSSLII
jgi:hypothetical protein